MPVASFALTGAQTDQALVAAPSGIRRIVVLRVDFIVDAASRVRISEGTTAAGTVLIDGDYAANGGRDKEFAPGGRRLAAATALNITTSAGNVKGTVEYAIEG